MQRTTMPPTTGRTLCSTTRSSGLRVVFIVVIFVVNSMLVGEIPGVGQDAPQASTGIIVLRNGHVVEGVIEQIGDRYRVHVGNGEINLRAANVLHMAANREAAFEAMRADRRRTSTGHLELAEWCIEQRLYNQATDELIRAIQINPSDPRVASLRKRMQRRAIAQAASAPTDPAQAPAVANSSAPMAGPNKPAASQAAVIAAAEPEPELSHQPPELIENFRRSVMPMMLNGCAANRCHGNAGAGGFEMFGLKSRVFGRRMVERNWKNVVEWIDIEKPERSTLLRRAAAAHGGADAPSFPEDSPAFTMIASWVEGQGRALAPAAKSESIARASFNEPNGAEGTGASLSGMSRLPAVVEESDGSASAEAAINNPQSLPVAAPTSVADRGARKHPTQAIQNNPANPADPFDPSAFNQRFHPNGPPLQSTGAAANQPLSSDPTNDLAPTNAGPTNAGPTKAGPTKAGPANAGPTNAGPTNAGPTKAGPTKAGPANAGPTHGASSAPPTPPTVPAKYR